LSRLTAGGDAEYLDQDNSGTHTECVTDNIDNAFKPLADWLRSNKRQAINSETGGGNTDSCQKYLCQQINFLKWVFRQTSGIPSTRNRMDANSI